ncbi:MAG: hypothetical protein IID39_02485 [Planctomycetes bacterium]|nr:hypothetical protein [Planctomycetota bacterium]
MLEEGRIAEELPPGRRRNTFQISQRAKVGTVGKIRNRESGSQENFRSPQRHRFGVRRPHGCEVALDNVHTGLDGGGDVRIKQRRQCIRRFRFDILKRNLVFDTGIFKEVGVGGDDPCDDRHRANRKIAQIDTAFLQETSQLGQGDRSEWIDPNVPQHRVGAVAGGGNVHGTFDVARSIVTDVRANGEIRSDGQTVGQERTVRIHPYRGNRLPGWIDQPVSRQIVEVHDGTGCVKRHGSALTGGRIGGIPRAPGVNDLATDRAFEVDGVVEEHIVAGRRRSGGCVAPGGRGCAAATQTKER